MIDGGVCDVVGFVMMLFLVFLNGICINGMIKGY